MLISKINLYTANTKNIQAKKITQAFKGNIPDPQKCFEMQNDEFFNKYGGYKGVITYNQILALKNKAEKSQQQGHIPNLAVAFIADPVMDFLYVTSQTDLIKGKAKWTDISDCTQA